MTLQPESLAGWGSRLDQAADEVRTNYPGERPDRQPQQHDADDDLEGGRGGGHRL